MTHSISNVPIPTISKRELYLLEPNNSDVKELNESLLHQVPGETKTYLSIDCCMDPDDAAYVGTEVLNNIEMSGMSEH